MRALGALEVFAAIVFAIWGIFDHEALIGAVVFGAFGLPFLLFPIE